jgi:hypothetical protein
MGSTCLKSQSFFRLSPSVLLGTWVGTLVLGLHSVLAAAQAPDLRPEWGHYLEVTQAPNCSFLSDVNHADEASPLALTQLMDHKTILSLNQRYQDMNRDYELKQKYGLVDNTQEQQHGDDVHHFARQVVGEVRRYQTSREFRQLKKAADQDDSIQPLMKPAAVVGAGVAIYSGTPVNLQIDEDTRLRAVTDVRNQTGQFALLSSVGTTAVDFDMNKPDPNRPYTPEIGAQPERYRLSFSRGLPVWDLSSGLSYGGTTSSVGASLSKSLAPNLTAVVDTVRPVQAGRYSSEESLKFFYGLQF